LAIGDPMSPAKAIAVYAVISGEPGLPFPFPENWAQGAYAALAQLTDAGLLARATTWATTEPRCANGMFNVTSGISCGGSTCGRGRHGVRNAAGVLAAPLSGGLHC
jgi:hypothetical protein